MNPAFNGDKFVDQEIRRLVERHFISTIVETGVFEGATTIVFASMVSRVYAIEISDEFWDLPGHLESIPNIARIKGDSGVVLRTLLPLQGRVLFYLDAHWGAHSPLLDELSAIARVNSSPRPVIVIHDFLNPAHPEYGFDSYDFGPYRWDNIELSIIDIYGHGNYTYRYNDLAEGGKRGIVYIEPK